MKIQSLLFIGCAAAFSLTACGSKSGSSANDAHDAEVGAHHDSATATRTVSGESRSQRVLHTAVAQLESRSDSTVTGTVTFTEVEMRIGTRVVEHQVLVAYNIHGLPEGATRGFHIHEFGDCSAPDASSAGGHFNPGGHDHGAPDAHDSHAGDLGNVEADAQGHAIGTMTVSAERFSVVGREANNIVGKSVIVHVGTDDLVSQPTGDAGKRAACGVIESQESN